MTKRASSPEMAVIKNKSLSKKGEILACKKIFVIFLEGFASSEYARVRGSPAPVTGVYTDSGGKPDVTLCENQR